MNYTAAKEYMLQRLGKDLNPDYVYHCYEHTLDVLRATEELAKGEGITDEEVLDLLRTAAVYHDCGFLERYELNEVLAAKIAGEELPSRAYSPEQISTIQRLIMVTVIGAEPTEKLESIIKDADFDYLGRNDYPAISLRLKEEWERRGTKYSLKEWYELQEKFLISHRFYTETAKRTRNNTKKKNLEFVREMLRTL